MPINVLRWIIQFGPCAILLTTVLISSRQRPSWLLRYQAWLRSSNTSVRVRVHYAVWFFVWLLVLGLGSVLVPWLTDRPAPLNALHTLFWGIGYMIFLLLFVPESWLLGDKERTTSKT